MAFAEGKPVPIFFSEDFVATEQDVADLTCPKPETRYCLVELPKEQLELLLAGETFLFKEHSAAGSATVENGGCAVLCTKNATFDLEFLENSNSLFVAALQSIDNSNRQEVVAPQMTQPEAELKSTVIAQARGQVFLKPAVPDRQRVRDLLAPHALGEAQSYDPNTGQPTSGMTTAMLEYEVAISRGELQALLQDGPYVEHDGVWRLLPTLLERDILDAAISIITALGWRLESIDMAALFQEVQQHFGDAAAACVPSVAVLRKALRSIIGKPTVVAASPMLPTQVDESSAQNSVGAAGADPSATASGVCHAISFDETMVNRSRGLQLLRESPSQVRERFSLPPPQPRPKRARFGSAAAGTSAGRDGAALQLEEFMVAFRELTGTETSTEEALKLLGDGAYVDDMEGTIHPIDASTLPPEPLERLKRLFELKTHWRPESLSMLIVPTLGAGQKVDPWLVKYTRSIYVEISQGTEERMLVKKFAGL